MVQRTIALVMVLAACGGRSTPSRSIPDSPGEAAPAANEWEARIARMSGFADAACACNSDRSCTERVVQSLDEWLAEPASTYPDAATTDRMAELDERFTACVAKAPAAEPDDRAFHPLASTPDGAQVLVMSTVQYSRPLVYRVVDVATNRVITEVQLVEWSKLPHGRLNGDPADERTFEAALVGNQALAEELERAGALVAKFGRNLDAVRATPDGSVVLANVSLVRWIMARGGEVTLMPTTFADPWIAPDGTILHRVSNGKPRVPEWIGVARYSPVTNTSKRLQVKVDLYGSSDWVAAGAGTVRIPAGGRDKVPLCVYELAVANGKLSKKVCLAGRGETSMARLSPSGALFAARTGEPGMTRLRLVDVETGKVKLDTSVLPIQDVLVHSSNLLLDDAGLIVTGSGDVRQYVEPDGTTSNTERKSYEICHLLPVRKLACSASEGLVVTSAPQAR